MIQPPVIGITVSLDHGKLIRKDHEYLYVKRAYSQAVQRAGGQPILLTPEITPGAVAAICDGIVISGGDDLPPELYGEQAHAQVNLESVERIEWERRLLDLFADSAKPVLGVCYGMQLINVHYGGSLHQDVSAACEAPLDHGGMGNVTCHDILIDKRSSLFPVLGARAEVCSTHHQAIKKLAEPFRVAATSEDGVIEAIEWKNILGVEWHPEADATGQGIYSLLVTRAKPVLR